MSAQPHRVPYQGPLQLGRPRRDVIAEIAEIEEIAPVRLRRVNGETRAFPDLNHVLPSRIITRAEAQLRRWPLYFPATPCGHGHIAPRWVTNQLCVDCRRTRAGKPPIGSQLMGATAAPADPPGFDSPISIEAIP